MASLPRPSALLRATTSTAAIAFALVAPTLASAQAGHHHHPAPADTATSASGQADPATAAPTPAASHASMFTVADPKSPRIAAGPRGPLWSTYAPRPVGVTTMGETFAERYLATATVATAPESIAARAELTTSQATKKLTKKCQKLVKITKAKYLKKLKKADKKARTKCLEQRRKIISNSKKKAPTNPGSTTPAPGSPTPAPGTTTPTPGSPTPTPGNPTPTTPAPTTPTTPTQPVACTTPGEGKILGITAFDEGAKFELSACGLKAGEITFGMDNTDGSEDHNLVVAKAYREVVADGQTSSIPDGGSYGGIPNVRPGKSGSTKITLAAGDYWLICTVSGHVAMAIKFKVFD